MTAALCHDLDHPGTQLAPQSFSSCFNSDWVIKLIKIRVIHLIYIILLLSIWWIAACSSFQQAQMELSRSTPVHHWLWFTTIRWVFIHMFLPMELSQSVLYCCSKLAICSIRRVRDDTVIFWRIANFVSKLVKYYSIAILMFSLLSHLWRTIMLRVRFYLSTDAARDIFVGLFVSLWVLCSHDDHYFAFEFIRNVNLRFV